MLALIFAVAAGICLAAGWWLGQVVLVYAALGTSAAGLLLVLVQVWRRRKAAAPAEDVEHDEEDTGEVTEEVTEVAAVEDEDDVVFVLPGRKRFHVAGCRLLKDREAEELTLAEAEEESFTPCTVCAESAVVELVGR
ncbi:hypothetical protein [Amycolatopsis sp.]|uniref:hypothetical protein n=1 Tax=Amycolatopsis sp. TaxID=37632 RepID=UPI002CF98057|nr:hypothetical protein [Amycolatopsis sp.]HVV11270.1 hypothetical protein [Amycolatopsis sp.]